MQKRLGSGQAARIRRWTLPATLFALLGAVTLAAFSQPSEPVQELPLSTSEAYVRGELSSEISTQISQFGYDLFRAPPETFAAVEAIPVGPQYLLGPSDELRITVWGKALSAEYAPVIDRDGKIALPTLGVLQLAGLTFGEAKELIAKEFSRYYTDFSLNVSMGRLRSIQIFVVGHARAPGRYTVSSLSTLINALFAAGGPSKSGTMRDIRVIRSGETVGRFDMYDFLLRGDKSGDVRVMPEDVVFIPPVGALVALAGNVKTPAIYELKESKRLADLIEMAGGFTATADTQRVQIQRISETHEQVLLTADLRDAPNEHNFHLTDGDIIKVFPIVQRITNPIYLEGNVLRPGTYEWREGIRVKDIVPSVDHLLPETLMDFALIERLVAPDLHMEHFSFDIRKALVEGDESENVLLSPHDTIKVLNKWDVMPKKMVRITGAVNKPGQYEYRPSMRLSNLIELAGGFKRYAYTKEAELTRVTPTEQGPLTEQLMVSLEPQALADPASDVVLQEDDYVFVRTVPGWKQYQMVSVTGEVQFPGDYTFEKGERLSDLIARAGGFTDLAYLKGAVFTRESVRELQQRSLDEAVDRLEQQLLASSAKGIRAALSPEEAAAEEAADERQQALLAKLRAAKAKGRVAMKLEQLDVFQASPHNIALEDNDRLKIPQMPQHIQIVGAVFNPSAFLYEPRGTLDSYLNQAGGLTEDADQENIYVLKVDGTAVSRRSAGRFALMRWDSGANRWEGGSFTSLVLDPGDTIVVPEKLEKVAWLREAKDITQILYQVAVTAGVLIVAL